MNAALTIVLPVHNVERTLHGVTARILELAETAARRLRLVVVDDGSTDGTYEAACELGRQFPQVTVLRQPFRRGLGPALDLVRRRVEADQVIVHDGVTPIDVDELSALLRSASTDGATPRGSGDAPEIGRGSRRFEGVSSLHSQLAVAHRSAVSFHWLGLDDRRAGSRGRRAAIRDDGNIPSAPMLSSRANSFAPLTTPAVR